MIYVSRKVVATIAAAVCLGIIGLSVLVWTTSKDDSVYIDKVTKPQQQKRVVLSQNELIEPDRTDEITKKLYIFLKASGTDTGNKPQGVIREGSFHTNRNQYGVATTFLVDFPGLKRTYKVTYSDDDSGYQAINVLCPTNEERIYDKTECKDSVST